MTENRFNKIVGKNIKKYSHDKDEVVIEIITAIGLIVSITLGFLE